MFYSNSGSKSNDSNARMVRPYWDLLGQPQRKVIVSRKKAPITAAPLLGRRSAV